MGERMTPARVLAAAGLALVFLTSRHRPNTNASSSPLALTVPARRPPTGSRRRPAHRSAGPVRPAGGARRPGDSRFPSGAGNTSPRACAAILAAFLLSPISPAAQTEPIPPQLTLADALRIAEARNPAFRAARQGVDIARAEARTAGRGPNPEVAFEGEAYPVFGGRRPSFWDDQALIVRFTAELETAGRRGHRVRSADAGVGLARAETADARRRLHLEVGRAYFALALAQADRAIAAAALEEIERVVALTEARFEAGEVAGVELRRLQVERLGSVDEVFTAELAVRTARVALLGLLGADDLRQALVAADPLQAPPLHGADGGLIATAGGVVADVERLQADADVERPDLLAARRARERAETEVERQRARRAPNVTAAWGYRRDFGMHAMDFALSIPVPLFGALDPGGVPRAEAERRRRAALEDAAESAVAVELQQAVDAVEVGAERVRSVEEYVRDAEQARAMVQSSYELGETALIDYLDAQREFRATQRVRNQALYELRVSLIELAAAVGAPPGGQP